MNFDAESVLASSPLGKITAYPDRYDATLLFAVSRSSQRVARETGDPPEFDGVDRWTAYELSWLETSGKPSCAVLSLTVPARSPAMVESKSLKLYLGSFSQTALSRDDLIARIRNDLSGICGLPVSVHLAPANMSPLLQREDLPGESIDDEDVVVGVYQPDSRLLKCSGPVIAETLRSSLFKSNCPVTGQPDYADIVVRYRGQRIDRAALLRYLVSYRQHSAFHESCIDQIFVDIARCCRCDQLTVDARFLRRGGIDINPFRSNFEEAPAQSRLTPRQ